MRKRTQWLIVVGLQGFALHYLTNTEAIVAGDWFKTSSAIIITIGLIVGLITVMNRGAIPGSWSDSS